MLKLGIDKPIFVCYGKKRQTVSQLYKLKGGRVKCPYSVSTKPKQNDYFQSSCKIEYRA